MPDREFFYESADGATRIRAMAWEPERPRAVLQIAHGICGSIAGYEHFAARMASYGFAVAGNDHLGHGKSVRRDDDLGFFAEEHGWDCAVHDMRRLRLMTEERFPGLPYFMLGHSMGSFLLRTYMIKYPEDLSGALICGTGQQPAAMVGAGAAFLDRYIQRRGARFRSRSLLNLGMGAMNRHLSPTRTPYDWISRDAQYIDRYAARGMAFTPTLGMLRDMVRGLQFIESAENVRKMRPELPVIFMSGEMDPVGEEGRGVRRAAISFISGGMRDVSLRLYADARHEILNEINRNEVYGDITKWLRSKMTEEE